MLIQTNVTKQDHFVISGVIAISIYLFCFLLFLLYISSPNVEKYDALTKNTVLELDVFIAEDIKIDDRNKTDNKDSKKSHEIVEKSKSITAKSKTSVKSLFANVKTNTKKIVLEEVNNVKNSEVNSRFKAKFEKQRKSNISNSKLLASVRTKASVLPSSNSSNNTDPYFSKIYELLAQRWSPMLIIDELSAKVLVMISSDGTFDYRFVSRSSNDSFNESLKSFLQSQTILTYPTHNKGRVAKIEVVFRTKGQ